MLVSVGYSLCVSEPLLMFVRMAALERMWGRAKRVLARDARALRDTVDMHRHA